LKPRGSEFTSQVASITNATCLVEQCLLRREPTANRHSMML